MLLLRRNNLKKEFIDVDDFKRKGISNKIHFKLSKSLQVQTNINNVSILDSNMNLNTILEHNYQVKSIYVINLENQIEKKILMKKKLEQLNLNVEFIQAVNGYENKQFFTFLKDNPQMKTLGAIGILETYRKILNLFTNKELKENPYHKILIFEDDICFHTDFHNIIKKHSIKDTDLIHLGTNFTNLHPELRNKKEALVFYNKSHIKKNHFIYGGYGMIYSFKFLMLLKKHIKLNYPIDVLYNKILVKENLSGCFFNPHLVIPIVNTSTNMGKRNQNKFMEKIGQNPDNYLDFQLSLEFNDIYVNYLLGITSRDTIKKKGLIKLIEGNNKSFVFIITSFNNEEWVFKNLNSIRKQNYPFWRVIYYDDNSSDNTITLVKEFIQKYQLENRFYLIENNIRNYQGYGRWISFHHCDDEEICVLLDGDDWLYDNNVLVKLNQLYKNNDIKVSYGGMVYYMNDNNLKIIKSKSYPDEIILNSDYQNYTWCTTHLRTGLAKLFKTIPLNYLKIDGEYIKCCTDWAEMFWVLNKSEGKHLPNNFIGCVYNKKASLGYDNSYYNKDKNVEWLKYRNKVELKYKNYCYNE